jgi:hypothetical protein
MVVNLEEFPVIVENHLVNEVSVHILVRTCESAKKDGVNMINIWAGTPTWIAPVVVVSKNGLKILLYI